MPSFFLPPDWNGYAGSCCGHKSCCRNARLGYCSLVQWPLYLSQKKSAYAILPGALTGIMPPVIGWVAGGGVLTDPRLVYLCCFFFLWQIAHSLLIIIEYGKEFELAGLPSLTMLFTPRQLSRITSIWVFAVGITCLLLPLFVSPPPLDLWLVLLRGFSSGYPFPPDNFYRVVLLPIPLCLKVCMP